MFFRQKKIKNTNQLQLVQSYRNEEGLPRQRIVASLGQMFIPEDSRRIVARCVEQRLRGEQDLFGDEITPQEAEWVDYIVKISERTRSAKLNDSELKLDGVLADKVETVNVVEFGPQLVGMEAWRALQLTEALLGMGMNRRAVSLAQTMVINRIVEPLSEWALIDWVKRTALPECLNVRITESTKDRLYKTGDELISRRKKIEKYLRKHEESLFGLTGSIVLYDVTNTHFEGLCKGNPKAAYGRNKQKRNDCLQVAVGMAFDKSGCALAHETFNGNISDSKTLFHMLNQLDVAAEPEQKPVVILDAGFASKENLQLLREKGYSYLVNITRGSRKKYARYFEAEDFSVLADRNPDEQVEVKTIEDPDDPETRLVLCRSVKRREKEQAMISKAEKKFIDDAESLKKRISAGRLKDDKKIHKAIGRLLQKHPRVSRYYDVEFENGVISAERKEDVIAAAYELCGDYVLKTDQTFDADVLWQLYMTLLKAEEGFKILKGTLGLRPNFHQKETRVDGHIFMTVLAYHLLSWINIKLEAAGDRRTWRTLRRILRTHSILTTRFPLENGDTVSVRKASLPDEEQIKIYDTLGINWRNAYKTKKSQMNA
jgi:transposase